MGDVMYAVAFGSGKDHGFRAPTVEDLQALAAAETELLRLLPQWEADNVLPTEPIRKAMTKDPANSTGGRDRSAMMAGQQSQRPTGGGFQYGTGFVSRRARSDRGDGEGGARRL